MASTTDFRSVMGLIGAVRAESPWGKPRGSNPAAKLGLRYERRVHTELKRHLDLGHIIDLEHNPWFSFTDSCGTNYCCPDFILHAPRGVFVVEVKYTWVPSAVEKFRALYSPVCAHVAQEPVYSLIICKNMVPGAPKPRSSLGDALMYTESVLHWPANGRIPW